MGGAAEPRSGPSFAVVIPMYNEEAGAERCVAEVCRALSRLPERSRLVVVEDGSRDQTAEILARLASTLSLLRVVFHAKNRGYGAALRTGVTAAREEGLEYVLFMDSDLTNSPQDIPRFVEKMAQGADVIKASRYVKGGGVFGVPPVRRVLSRTANLVAGSLFRIGIHDCTNGFRAVRTDLLLGMDLRENDFSIIVEELYHCALRSLRFVEVPVVLTCRDRDLRPTSFSYRPTTCWRYLKYCFRACLRLPSAATVDAHGME